MKHANLCLLVQIYDCLSVYTFKRRLNVMLNESPVINKSYPITDVFFQFVTEVICTEIIFTVMFKERLMLLGVKWWCICMCVEMMYMMFNEMDIMIYLWCDNCVIMFWWIKWVLTKIWFLLCFTFCNISSVSKHLFNGKAPQHKTDVFTHIKGLLYKYVMDSGKQILALVIAKSWKYMALVEAHNKLGHQGNSCTYCQIKRQY